MFKILSTKYLKFQLPKTGYAFCAQFTATISSKKISGKSMIYCLFGTF